MDTGDDLAGHESTGVAFRAGLPGSRGGDQTMARYSRKSTQLERLLKAMVEVGNSRGYGGANVSAVIAEAGVSRPTFYDYFADREDAFRAAVEYAHQGLLGAVATTLAEVPGEEAVGAAVRRMVAYADEQPALMRILMSESMAGGQRALDARDRGVRLIAAAIGTAGKGAARGAQVVDLDPVVVVGAVYRMLGTLLRREQPGFATIAEDLVGWLDSYRRPRGECHWRALKPGRTSGPSPHVPAVPIQKMPALFPPGRPRVTEEHVLENHRLRILYATARLVQERGFAATRVEDITRAASVDGRVFYRQFSDKQDAFEAVHELGFQQVVDVTSKAFFSGESWPERSWEGGRALTQLLQDNPLVGTGGASWRPTRSARPASGSRTATRRSCTSFRKASSRSRSPPSRRESRWKRSSRRSSRSSTCRRVLRSLASRRCSPTSRTCG